MFHYTDIDGFKAIAAQSVWKFKAFIPAAAHPEGAYFTTLPPRTTNLARRLRVPRQKLEQLFHFQGVVGLLPLDGGKGRGEYVFYSPIDYDVTEKRQRYRGPASDFPPEIAP